MDYKGETDAHYESSSPTYGAARKPTFMQKYKAHMKKWWWAHLLFFIIATLCITLPL